MHPYVPHVVYSIALTSVSTHLLIQKTAFTEQRASLSARISILESIARTLRSDRAISDRELEKLRKLARAHTSETSTGVARTGWREALSLSRRTPNERSDELDEKEIEAVLREFEPND